MATTGSNPRRSWHQRGWVVVGTLAVFFPAGLVLVLLARWRRWCKPVVALPFALFFLLQLHLLFGLRISWGGAGPISPHVEFFRPEVHQAALAAHRGPEHTLPIEEPPAGTDAPLDAEWPGFRGARRDGVVGSAVRLPWPEEGPRLLWDQSVGGGHASFAIVGGRALTIEQRGEEEVVTCYGMDSGRELWAYGYGAQFDEFFGGAGPRATPAVDAGRVYALGATGVLTCLDAETGRLYWKRNILDDAKAENLTWGVSASPLVFGNRVYTVPGGSGASVIAYDALSGEAVLKGGEHKGGYASPMLASILGTEHLLVFDAAGLCAYGPDRLEEFWHFPWKTSYDVNSGQPIVVDQQRILISSGYGHGCALVEVRKAGSSLSVEELWMNRNLKLKFSSAVVRDGFVYGLDDAILTCLDASTGKRQWKGGRYGYGQVVLSGGYLIVQCENGDLALVEATAQQHREVRRCEALGSKTWNHPAVAAGKLLIRNDRRMMCFDLAAGR